jgi:hypothetical protein
MVHRPDYNRDSGGNEDELVGDVLMFRPKRRGQPDERTTPSVG